MCPVRALPLRRRVAEGQNAPVTPPGGRRRAVNRPPLPKRPLVLHLAGIVATAAAWIFLVREAIDFGGLAKGGDGPAWIFAALATIGAITCLLLSLLITGRILAMLGIVDEHPRTGRRKKD